MVEMDGEDCVESGKKGTDKRNSEKRQPSRGARGKQKGRGKERSVWKGGGAD